MKVSLNNNTSTPIQQALSDSMQASAAAAQRMSTGEQFIRAYEDPTSFAIGLQMRSDLEVLRTTLDGITQSQSMLYIAEDGMKSIYNTVNKMKEILGTSKVAYMTDHLIHTTLSPTYVQLKAEINRIADSVNFNGQTLINGQGGVKNAGTASSTSADPFYIAAAASTVTLAKITGVPATGTPIISGLKANVTVSGTTTTAATMTFNAETDVTPQVIGGTVTSDEKSGDIDIAGATIFMKGVTAYDGTNNAVGNITINNVDLKFKKGEFDFVNRVIKSDTGKTPMISNITNITASDFTFERTSGSITKIDTFTATTPLTASNIVLASGNDNQISNMTQQYSLSGGIAADSAFTFVTGIDLNNEIITFDLPNMRLTKTNEVLGMIDTINTSNNISLAKPTDLTNLNNSKDADIDIPLVEALLSYIIAQIDQIGAYETRLMNVERQMQNSVREIDNAQGVFMNADLAEQTENFTIATVQTNISISCLRNLTNALTSLQQLVS